MPAAAGATGRSPGWAGEPVACRPERVPATSPACNSFAGDGSKKVDDRELKIATQLVDSLTTKFKPEKYHDEYREKVLELIEKKAHGENIVTRPEAEEKTPRRGSDLIAALEASLAKTRNGNGAASVGTGGDEAVRRRRGQDELRRHPDGRLSG